MENIEPVSEIAELNNLREKVLRGEKVSPDEYGRVLVFVRKIRRAGGAASEKSAKEKKPGKEKAKKVDATTLFSTPVKQ